MTTTTKIERITCEGFDGREYTADYSVVIQRDVFGDREVILDPVGPGGSFASSDIGPDRYEYRNGGNLYRSAVDRAREILASL
jgi:hypothetical protein